MDTAAWILVIFLSTTLLIFLISTTVLVIKLIGISKEVKKIVIKGQDIAEKADDIVENVKEMSSIGGLVKTLVNRYTRNKDGKKPQ